MSDIYIQKSGEGKLKCFPSRKNESLRIGWNKEVEPSSPFGDTRPNGSNLAPKSLGGYGQILPLLGHLKVIFYVKIAWCPDMTPAWAGLQGLVTLRRFRRAPQTAIPVLRNLRGFPWQALTLLKALKVHQAWWVGTADHDEPLKESTKKVAWWWCIKEKRRLGTARKKHSKSGECQEKLGDSAILQECFLKEETDPSVTLKFCLFSSIC